MAYIAPIHRPSSVRHAIQLSFLAPHSRDLIIAKANQLEIWSPDPQSPDQLLLQHTKSIYGKVTLLERLRPTAAKTDHLFIGTDRFHYFTVSWDRDTKGLKTEKSYVDIAEKSSRDSQTGDRVHIDPTNRFMTLECYEGVVNVLPLRSGGKGKRRASEMEVGELGDPVPVRIPELFVRSTCFLHQPSSGTKLANPELAILQEDTQQNLHVKIRQLEYTPSLRPQEEPASADLEKVRNVEGDIELGASHLIPLPHPVYGFLVLGETGISYVTGSDYDIINTRPLREATVFISWCVIDDQRYALADDYGKLYLLYIQQDSDGGYADHQVGVLGETSRASTLVYLDAGRIFIGSNQGDSQIVRIIPQGLEVVQTFPNVAPILDFTIMDMGNRSAEGLVNEFSSGQARIVTGSGAFKDGSLRSVRSGVALEDVGSIAVMGAPISGLFSLSSEASPNLVDTLLVSLVDHTRVFTLDQSGQVEEQDSYKGLHLDCGTLNTASYDNRFIQVTTDGVFVTLTDGPVVTNDWQWKCPADTAISSAQIDGPRVLMSLQGARLVLLDVSSGITELASRDFTSNEQVSCLTMNTELLPSHCVVGFWQSGEVSLLSLDTLDTVISETVSVGAATVVPRSLCLAQIFHNSPTTLFVGLADGNVITYALNITASTVFDGRKSMILGTQQPTFATLPRDDGSQNVFAICEHSSLVYGSEGRMVYSAVTAEDATSVCSFNSEAFPGAIAIATAKTGELKLAFVDEERTTHVETLPVRETVRRIAYSPALKSFGLGTIRRQLSSGVEEVVSHFKLVDEVVFQELHSYALNDDELIESVIRCELNDGTGSLAERFIVGTAYLDDDGRDGVRGRILIFEVTAERQLRSIMEHPLKGACRCLAICNGNIVAALIKTVVVFALEYDTPSEPHLEKRAAFRTATAPIDITVTDDVIAVTDLMKSLTLVQYLKGQTGTADKLIELARHYETLWSTAVANVADNTYLESDAEGNLVVLQHELGSYSEEDKRRLRVTSEMHLGEMVNRIRRINIQPSPGAVIIPRAFLATVEGSLYMFALIAPGKQDLLMRMQAKIAEMVQSPGNIPFAKNRGFKTAVRDMSSEGPMRFVDGTLLERFSDCDEITQQSVVDELGENLEEMKSMVESLRRTH